MLIVEHLEEDLRGDVVGIVAGKHKLIAIEDVVQVHTQEVLPYDVLTKLRKLLVEVSHRLLVNLDGLDGAWLGDQKLRHHAHTRSDLEHRNVGTGIHRVGYGLSDAEVGEEVLAEVLLRPYGFYHSLLSGL